MTKLSSSVLPARVYRELAEGLKEKCPSDRSCLHVATGLEEGETGGRQHRLGDCPRDPARGVAGDLFGARHQDHSSSSFLETVPMRCGPVMPSQPCDCDCSCGSMWAPDTVWVVRAVWGTCGSGIRCRLSSVPEAIRFGAAWLLAATLPLV